MAWKYNPFTGVLDIGTNFTMSVADGRYLKLDTSNNPLTGELKIIPASGNTALTAHKDIILFAARKLYLDGFE
jgi:hypothetical protein